MESEFDCVKMTLNLFQLIEISSFISKSFINKPCCRDTRMKQAIQILYQQHILSDGWDMQRKPQKFVFEPFFWKTIEREQLVNENDEYKKRFITSLAQVVYDMDINIRKHKYGKITNSGNKYSQYSADIFRKGHDSKKCSRIFYCKVKSIIHFHEYNPDVH